MTIPCIVFYIMQLFIDSFIANTWASKYERFAAVEAVYNEQLAQLDAAGPAAAAGGLGQQVAAKVAAKLSAGGAGAIAVAELPAADGGAASEGDRLIGTGVVLSGGHAARPSRAAQLLHRRSSASDGEEAGLMQIIELTDSNPLAEGGGGAAGSAQQQQQQQVAAGRSTWR